LEIDPSLTSDPLTVYSQAGETAGDSRTRRVI
jgi:hypothetical protein